MFAFAKTSSNSTNHQASSMNQSSSIIIIVNRHQPPSTTRRRTRTTRKIILQLQQQQQQQRQQREGYHPWGTSNIQDDTMRLVCTMRPVGTTTPLARPKALRFACGRNGLEIARLSYPYHPWDCCISLHLLLNSLNVDINKYIHIFIYHTCMVWDRVDMIPCLNILSHELFWWFFVKLRQCKGIISYLLLCFWTKWIIQKVCFLPWSSWRKINR